MRVLLVPRRNWRSCKVFKKKEEPVISFVSSIMGLHKIEEIVPKPSQKFIPDWWKPIPNHKGQSEKIMTVKSCPSFPDYFSQGYIIPMWADTLIKYDATSEVWSIKCGRENDFSWDFHFDEQLIDYTKPALFEQQAQKVLKAMCPWRIITKPGWSVMQLPLYYHFDNRFSVMPGVIHTDIHHDINQQVLIYNKNLKKDFEIFIKRGEPFVQYIPFKREKIDHDVRLVTSSDHDKTVEFLTNLKTKFIGNGAYSHRFKNKK